MWIELTKPVTDEPVAINMDNIWKMEPARGDGTELHSLGANTGGSSASVIVAQSIGEVLRMMRT